MYKNPLDKMHKNVRILQLEQDTNTKTKTNTGMVDTRLFTGENTLKAYKYPNSTLWGMKYEFGGLPAPLKQSFTSFDKLYTYASRYFGKRGVKITKVID
jgi:hypothetical protein